MPVDAHQAGLQAALVVKGEEQDASSAVEDSDATDAVAQDEMPDEWRLYSVA